MYDGCFGRVGVVGPLEGRQFADRYEQYFTVLPQQVASSWQRRIRMMTRG
jgi:hypothetical protein